MGVDHCEVGIRKGYLAVVVLCLMLDLHFLLNSLAVLLRQKLVLSRHDYILSLPLILPIRFGVSPSKEHHEEVEEDLDPSVDGADDVAHMVGISIDYFISVDNMKDLIFNRYIHEGQLHSHTLSHCGTHVSSTIQSVFDPVDV